MGKVLTQLSGGLDSVAVLGELLGRATPRHFGFAPEEIHSVFFDYGQPYAEQERKAARKASEHYGIADRFLDRSLPLEVQSSTEVSEYVPLRNLALLGATANLAVSLGCKYIAVGSKSAVWRPDDPYSFRDSTKRFYDSVQYALLVAAEPGSEPPRILMPVLGWSKSDVLLSLLKDGVNIRDLWSCYVDGSEPCGECHHCKEIAEAWDDPEVGRWMHSQINS